MKSRLYALDALRLIAALLVLAHHWHKHTPAQVKALEVFPQWLSWHGGYIGVASFFTISGFVILASAQGATARGFVFARIIRLYPAFWICCTLTYFGCINTKFSTDQAGYIVSMTMFPGAFGHQAVDGVYWTLAVEARFYLLIALLIAMDRLDRLEWFLGAWVGLGLVTDDPRLRAAFALDWAPFFAAGCLLQILRSKATPARWLALGALMILAMHYATVQAAEHARKYGIANDPQELAACIVAIFGVMAAIAFGKISLPKSRTVIAMGAMSYPLYLLHSMIGWKALGLYATDIPSYLCVFAGMMFLAWSVAHFEPRLQEILRKVLTAREIGYTRVSA